MSTDGPQFHKAGSSSDHSPVPADSTETSATQADDAGHITTSTSSYGDRPRRNSPGEVAGTLGG